MKKFLILGALMFAGHTAAFAAVSGDNMTAAELRAPGTTMVATAGRASAAATHTQKPTFKVMLASAGRQSR